VYILARTDRRHSRRHGGWRTFACTEDRTKTSPTPRHRYNGRSRYLPTVPMVDGGNGGTPYRRQDVYRIVHLKKKGLKIPSNKWRRQNDISSATTTACTGSIKLASISYYYVIDPTITSRRTQAMDSIGVDGVNNRTEKVSIAISRSDGAPAVYADGGNYCCKILLYIRHVDTKVWRGSFRLGGVGVGRSWKYKFYTVVGSEKSKRTFHIVGMMTVTVTTTLIISYYYSYYYYNYYRRRRRRTSIIVPTSIVHPLRVTALHTDAHETDGRMAQ